MPSHVSSQPTNEWEPLASASCTDTRLDEIEVGADLEGLSLGRRELKQQKYHLRLAQHMTWDEWGSSFILLPLLDCYAVETGVYTV